MHLSLISTYFPYLTHLIKFYEQFNLKFILLCLNFLLKDLHVFCKRCSNLSQQLHLWYKCPNKNKSFLCFPFTPRLHLNPALPVISEVKSQVSYRYKVNINTPRTAAIGLPPTSPLDTIYSYTAKCLCKYFAFNFSLWRRCSYWFQLKCQGFSLKSLPFSNKYIFLLSLPKKRQFQNLTCNTLSLVLAYILAIQLDWVTAG